MEEHDSDWIIHNASIRDCIVKYNEINLETNCNYVQREGELYLRNCMSMKRWVCLER
jgi:hypothetical protein